MNEQLGRDAAARTPQLPSLCGQSRTGANSARRIRKALPWGSATKWRETLKALENSALIRNVVAMCAECTTDDGRYALAEELIDAIDARLTELGRPPVFGDRVRSFVREVSEAQSAVTEVLLHPNDPNAKARAREELSGAERAIDELGDALATPESR